MGGLSKMEKCSVCDDEVKVIRVASIYCKCVMCEKCYNNSDEEMECPSCGESWVEDEDESESQSPEKSILRLLTDVRELEGSK